MTVTRITKSRKELEEEIEKAANASNSDNYVCPYCYAVRPKAHVEVHKKTCTELR
jgi:hypothetical protein